MNVILNVTKLKRTTSAPTVHFVPPISGIWNLMCETSTVTNHLHPSYIRCFWKECVMILYMVSGLIWKVMFCSAAYCRSITLDDFLNICWWWVWWMMVMVLTLVVTGYKGSFLSLQGFLPLHRRQYRVGFPVVSSVDPQYRCCWCGKASTTRYDYDKHLRTHTGEKPFVCHICPFRTGDRSSLSKHVRRHHQLKPLTGQGLSFPHHH